MKYNKITVTTAPEAIEPLCALIYSLGIQGVEVEDAAEFAQFLEQNRASWDYVDNDLAARMSHGTRVSVYLSDNAYGADQLASLRSGLRELDTRLRGDGLDPGTLAVGIGNIDEEDWAENWKRYFKPMQIGGRILILPEWEPLPEDLARGRAVFRVDPGMSFGTGTHQSTQLCLELMERYIRPGDRLLDLGCGSGILGVTGLLLGASETLGVDIDPNAAEVAVRNAALNGVGADRYGALSGDICAGGEAGDSLRSRIGSGWNMVLANIVSDVILSIAPHIGDFLIPGGIFIASGIIDTRADEVERGIVERSGGRLVPVERVERDGWVAMAYSSGQ